jgi:hypothetical protein
VQALSTKAENLCGRIATAKLPGERTGVQIAGCFTAGNHDPHGSCAEFIVA